MAWRDMGQPGPGYNKDAWFVTKRLSRPTFGRRSVVCWPTCWPEPRRSAPSCYEAAVGVRGFLEAAFQTPRAYNPVAVTVLLLGLMNQCVLYVVGKLTGQCVVQLVQFVETRRLLPRADGPMGVSRAVLGVVSAGKLVLVPCLRNGTSALV